MNMLDATHALKARVSLRLASPLLLRSGETGDFTDSTIERTPKLHPSDPERLHINGYVWANLIRRALTRINDPKSKEVGKYHRQNAEGKNEKGVSPLWCDGTTAVLHGTTANHGNRIHRKWGAVETTGSFTDELAIAGLPLEINLTVFCAENDYENWRKSVLRAFWVVNEGIENIGGGWGYGYGRLSIESVKTAKLELKKPEDSAQLWGEVNTWTNETEWKNISVTKNWTVVAVNAKVADGQLLAVKTELMPIDTIPAGKQPDTYVFRRSRLQADGTIDQQPTIPGKAIRQALLSTPLERKLRTRGDDICETPGGCCTCSVCRRYRDEKKKKGNSPHCTCLRCAWFGSTSKAGVIAVTDAPVANPQYEVVNRVQLCEHSMQNMNLFSGEFLKGGQFTFKIYIDDARDSAGLAADVKALLDEMRIVEDEEKRTAPKGWYRLGGTSACTGQVEVIDYV